MKQDIINNYNNYRNFDWISGSDIQPSGMSLSVYLSYTYGMGTADLRRYEGIRDYYVRTRSSSNGGDDVDERYNYDPWARKFKAYMLNDVISNRYWHKRHEVIKYNKILYKKCVVHIMTTTICGYPIYCVDAVYIF